MARIARAMGGVSVFATVLAAITSSSDASAYKPHRSPEQRAGGEPMSTIKPAAAPLVCGHNAGGAPSPVACTMAYGGGQVISNVQIVPVFWTYGGKTVDANVMAWAPSYMAALVDSPYLDLLSEYSTSTQTITRGTSLKPYTITPTVATGATVKDSQISKELAAQVKAGTLPPVTNDAKGKPNTLYMLFFPTGVVITEGTNSDGTPSTSCVDFCGYHSSGSTYLYAVIPDLSQVQTYTRSDGGTVTEPCGYGCSYEASTKPEVDWFNGTVSHEIGEAVTDPVGGSGWYDSKDSDFACAGSKSQNQPGGGEIGDVCVGYYDDEYVSEQCEDTQSVPGTNIAAQITWSNALNGCYSANPATGPKCPPAGCEDGGAGPVDPALDAGGTSSGSSSGGSSGSSSGGSSGSSSGGSSGSSSGGSSGSSSGGSSGSSSGGSSSGGDNGGSSSGTLGVGSGSGSSGGSGGGNADSGSFSGEAPGAPGSSSGCSCTAAGALPASPFALAGVLMAFGAAFGRRTKRRG